MKEQNLGRKVANEAATSFAGMSIGSVFRYIFSILMARWLGPQMLGLYSLGNAVIRIGEIFALMGLDNGVLRFVSRDSKNIATATHSIYSSIKMGLISSLIFALILYLSSEWIVYNFLNEESFLVTIIKVYALSLPFCIPLLIASSATQGFKTMKYKIIVEHIMNPMTHVFAFLIAYIYLGDKLALLVPPFLSPVIGLVFILLFLKKFIDLDLGKIITAHADIKILKFSVPLMFVSAIGIVMHWVDVVMLGIFSDANTVGMYHPIERTSGLIRMILFAFAGIFSPLFSQYFYEKKSQKMTEIYQLSTKWILLLSLPIFIFLMLFSEPMLMVFGNQFNDFTSLRILATGMMIQTFFGLGSSSLTMSGFSNLNLLNVSIALIVNIILNFILIPQYGILGAAFATTFSLIIISALRFFENYYILDLNLFSSKLIKPLISGIFVILISILFQKYILNMINYSLSVFNLLAYLFLGLSFVLIGYFIFYSILGIDKEDSEMLDVLKNKFFNR
jgi:O-antigen/teichoic acid export membrane protein